MTLSKMGQTWKERSQRKNQMAVKHLKWGKRGKKKAEILPYPSQSGKDQQNNWRQLLNRIGGANTYSLLVGLQIGPATLEISVENHQKCKNKSSLWLRNTTPWHVVKWTNILFHRYLLSHVHFCCIQNS